MIGVRTAVVVSALAGLAYVAGQGPFARDLETLRGGWKTRLQILVGRPAPESESAPSVRSSVSLADTSSPNTGRDTVASSQPERPGRRIEVAAAAPSGSAETPRPKTEVGDAESDATQDSVDGFSGRFEALQGTWLRREPSLEAEGLTALTAGQRLEVTGRTFDRLWYRARVEDRSAYVPAGDVRALEIDTATGRVTLDRVDQALDGLAANLKQARFHEVVHSSDPLREQLEQAGRWVSMESRMVRLELLCATAQLALGHEQDASLSLERALAMDAALELDPQENPPKLRRLLTQIRRAR